MSLTDNRGEELYGSKSGDFAQRGEILSPILRIID